MNALPDSAILIAAAGLYLATLADWEQLARAIRHRVNALRSKRP